MWLLQILTWVSYLIQIGFCVICIISGLYYLADLVEEYPVTSKKIIKWTTISVLLIQIGLLLFEDLPTIMLIFGILNQIGHLIILKTFPYISLTSPTFVTSLVFLVVNHYFAFMVFSVITHTFAEIMAYFTICLWLVPFLLLISLSADDLLLPVVVNEPNQSTNNDFVSLGGFGKNKRYGLITIFNYFKEIIFPQRSKKRF